MSWTGWLGVWLLAGSGVALVIEVVVLVPMVRRFVIGLTEVQALAEIEAEATWAELRLFARGREELRRALVPYRRPLRVLRHPLVAALAASYRRRWRGR